MAAQENHVDVVSYLLANGASQDITTEVCNHCIHIFGGHINNASAYRALSDPLTLTLTLVG